MQVCRLHVNTVPVTGESQPIIPILSTPMVNSFLERIDHQSGHTFASRELNQLKCSLENITSTQEGGRT